MSDERDDDSDNVVDLGERRREALRRELAAWRTGRNAHAPTPLPQWVIERLERHMDRLYFDRPIPEKYRARYEEDGKD